MSLAERAYARFKFLLSLPERSLRALAALATGTTTLLTETLLPESLRGTQFYRVSIGMMQNYVIERIAQVEGETDDLSQPLPEDFAQRKIVGTALETAGFFMIGASPLWIFAILADVSGSGKVFLDRLAIKLKEQGVIDPRTDFNRLEDVLDAVQQASTRTALAIDIPPLSRADVIRMVAEMRAHYGSTFRSAVDLVPRLETLWQRMEAAAGPDQSLFNRLVGIMTVDALELGRAGGKAVVSVGAAGLQMFDESILRSYRKTLSSVSRDGLWTYLRMHYAPFLLAAGRHFDADRASWIERSIGGAGGDETGAL